MSTPIVPELHRLMIPERSGVDAVMCAADQVQVRIERLKQEVALRDQTIAERDEEIAGLKCRLNELQAEAMEAAGNYRRPQAESIVRGVS